MTKINLDDVYIDPFWALKIPANTAMRRKILPFLEWEGQVQVAVLDANDSSIARVVSRAVGREVKLIEADKGSFERALVNTYENMAQAGAQGKTGGGDDVVEMSERMLESALMRQSSDIHIDPEADKTFIRFRTHGQLEEYEILDSSKHVALCSRLKVISSMDISEKRSPQDGQFSFESKSMGRKIDVRVATIATKYGEKMTMRLMAMDVSTFTLEKLGMDREDLGRFEKALQQPHGIILMTGPTGSGKSTSLYAALSHIRKGSSQNIITIEDPVEYDLYGVTQVAVDNSEKVTFAKALRSVLRHDPDIIMIGEIRDKETADIAVKASITGHLVLSSLHTNSAPSVITRLADMGVERYLIAATLRLAVAQRLVKQLCDKCRKPRQVSAEEAQTLGMEYLEGKTVYDAGSCIYCGGKGYKGRVGIFEMLQVDQNLSRQIAQGCEENEIIAVMKEGGQRSLLEDGIHKVLAGETTLDALLAIVVN